MGPTIKDPVLNPLAVLHLDNRQYIMFWIGRYGLVGRRKGRERFKNKSEREREREREGERDRERTRESTRERVRENKRDREKGRDCVCVWVWKRGRDNLLKLKW